MTSWTEILKANKGLHARDSFPELWGLKLKAARAEFPDYTITGTLPLTFNSRAAVALKNYRIHGTTEGAGVETVSGEPAGFKIPILNTSGVTENLFDVDDVQQVTVTSSGSPAVRWGIPFSLSAGNYTFKAFTLPSDAFIYAVIKHNDETYSDISYITTSSSIYTKTLTLIEGDILYIYNASGAGTKDATIEKMTAADIVLVQGSTAPDHYIPHRYESNYDLFIGDSKLGEEEYVDYGEQKIYKMSGSTLVPTDPPVPLPPIPTYKDENTLSSAETVGEVSITGKITEMA